MIIHKITTSLDFNYWLKHLGTQLNKTANQNSLTVPKVVKPMKIKRYHKTFGTSL